MANCLVTKLKENVSNNNLLPGGSFYINAVELNSISDNEQKRITLYAVSGKTFKVIAKDGGYFGTSASTIESQKLTTIDVTPSGVTLFFKNGTYRVEITDKYNVFVFDSSVSNTTLRHLFNNIPAENFSFSADALAINGRLVGNTSFVANKNLENVVYNGSTELDVDLSDFTECTKLTSFSILNVKSIKGQLSMLGKSINLVRGEVTPNCDLGSIEELVAAQIENGRASATENNHIFIDFLLSSCSFGGNFYTSGYCHLLWDSINKITVYVNGSTVAKCSTIYAKGATAEEIAAWENAGKTVVQIS